MSDSGSEVRVSKSKKSSVCTRCLEPNVAAVCNGQQIATTTAASLEVSPQEARSLAHVPSAQQKVPWGHVPPLSHPGVTGKTRAGRNASGHCDTLNFTVIKTRTYT